MCDCRMADWSGVGRYTTSLVRALAASGEVTVVQLLGPGLEPPVPRAEAFRARRNPFTLGGAREFAAAVRQARPQLTHALHFPTPLPAPHPLVVTLMDLSPLLVPGVMPSAAKRAVYRFWNARASRVAERIVVPSAHTAGDVARAFPAAAPKTRVIALAADDFASGPMGRPPAVAAGARYLLTMGNTKPHKDLPTLLRAFAAASPAAPDVRLLLAGPDVPGYVAGVLGADPSAEKVSFTGAVSDEELRALYAGAVALVFPSLYEGFGLPVLEAMSFGTPVVVSDAASLPEVAGDAALTFPAGDPAALAAQLRAVMTEAAERERLSAAGRERVAAFTWAGTARETIAVYREVLR